MPFSVKKKFVKTIRINDMKKDINNTIINSLILVLKGVKSSFTSPSVIKYLILNKSNFTIKIDIKELNPANLNQS
jgi:hypothetical protein